MKFILALVSFCFIGSTVVVAQQGGAQTIRLAQSVYEQGRLHELPDLLKDSQVATFSKNYQVDAYRLLTLAYIYLEEPELADVSMLKLLDANHFYEPNEQVEPAEFIGLYKTFRTKPVFNYGFKGGLNGTQPLLNSAYYVSSGAPGKGKNSLSVGFQVGGVFEKEILSKSKNKIFGNGRLSFAPEIFYTSRAFKYTNPNLFTSDSLAGTSVADGLVTVKQNWLDLNPIVQMKIGKSKTALPYVGFGPGISYLLSAPTTLVTTRSNGAGVVSGPAIPFNTSYNKIVPSLIGIVGIKYRFGETYLVAEFRIQYGLANPVNSATRTNTSGAFENMYQLSDYKPISMAANIGVVIPYFNPIKLKHK